MSKPLPRDPARTCVACRQEASKGALIRAVRGAGGAVVLDPTGRAPGRGAYLHREAGCIEVARKRRALERALKAATGPDFWSQLEG